MSRPTRAGVDSPVLKSIFRFIDHLEHVSIDHSRVEEVADEFAEEDFPLPAWREPVFIDETKTSPEEVLDFFFVGNSINFAFRDFNIGEKFEAEYNGANWSGAFGMWACLKRAYEDGIPILSGEYLSNLTENDLRELFEASNEVEIPMLTHRQSVLNEVGDVLVTEYNGRFHNLIKEAKPALYAEGEGIVDLLVTSFNSFNDSCEIKVNSESIKLCFYKRAQLAPAMAFGRFNDSNRFTLRDPYRFTVFADYNLPNVLRGLNILQYDSWISETIENGRKIESGSREELEIRSATIYAAEKLQSAINSRRDACIYGPHLDAKLFFKRDEIDSPIHKTKTIDY